MKWSQLKKNTKVKSLIIEIENHMVYYTRLIHSYDLRYSNQNEVWSLEYWKLIQSQWTNLMITFNLNWMVIRKSAPIKKEDWTQWSRILHFAWLPLKQHRSDKHSVVSMLLLWYWRFDSDDCNYIILQSECDGKFALEWTLILAICLICYSRHSSRWHLEL